MLEKLEMSRRTAKILSLTSRNYALPIVISFLTLTFSLVALADSQQASAQQDTTCETINLGALGSEAGDELKTDGSWTTEDCDSRFRSDSDVHTYQFEVADSGRIRIDLTSSDGDSFLYLLSQDGSRIADNDDGGDDIDARVERDLVEGTYLVEATTVGGRQRGTADFTLTISRVEGCEPTHLGQLLSSANDLTGSGSWSLDTCGSQFVVDHPAQGFSFELPQEGRVLIDLTSENGDPVMSLISSTRGLIAANDDGGVRRNSRIEQFLPAGLYLIEATTYLRNDLQPISADFTLNVHLVDETEEQNRFNLKIEEIFTPEGVVAGEPFDVHYRVGNLGGGTLAAEGGNALIYVYRPGVYETTGRIHSSELVWQHGISYHTGDETTRPGSLSFERITPFEITIFDPGPSWIYVAVWVRDNANEEIGFHGIWRNLTVLNALTFDSVDVEVDGSAYNVSTEADEEGSVSVSVSSVRNPATEVDADIQAKAIYTAGVHTQLLDGIFERPAIADLPTDADAETFNIGSPSSSVLIKSFTDHYLGAVEASGIAESFASGEAVNLIEVEDLILDAAESASARYASMADSWSALLERIEDGENLKFEDALELYSQLAYAERVASPTVMAGKIVQAARDADLGWENPEVQSMLGELTEQALCGNGPAMLGEALEDADAENIETLLTLDSEMRSSLPIYGLADNVILCALSTVDADNSRFLELLSIDDSDELSKMLAPEPTAKPEPQPYMLRIIARIDDDDRLEHGVELSGGERVMPTVRFMDMDSDSTAGRWLISSDVEVDGETIGKIRSRRLEDGRVEVSFLTTSGENLAPDIRYIPVDPPSGVWFRSGEIEVPRTLSLSE